MDSLTSSQKAVGRLAQWTSNLLNAPIVRALYEEDQFLFAHAYAALYPFYPKLLPTHTYDLNTEAREEIRKTAKDLQRIYGDSLTSTYTKLFYQGCMLFEAYDRSGDWSAWDKFLTETIKSASSMYSTYNTVIEKNIDLIGDILELAQGEKNLLEFQILRGDIAFDIFYRRLFDYGRKNKGLVGYYLDQMFDEFDISYLSRKSTLIQSGIISYSEHTGYLSPISTSFANLFFANDIFTQIVKKMEKKPSASGALGSLGEQDKAVIVELFTKAVDTTGINILTYGSTNIDKKTTAYDTLNDAGFNIYALNTKSVSRSDLSARAYIAQRYLDNIKDSKSTLLIEDADSVLSRRTSGFMAMFEGMSEKTESEDVLENDECLLDNNPIPTIWIIDSPEYLIDENVGRFLFHCEIKAASRADRRTQIESIVSNLGLSADVQAYLAKYPQLSARQVTSATKLAGIVGQNADEHEVILKRSIHQSQRALGRDQMETIRESVTTYNLDYINVKSAFTLRQVIDSLKKNPKGALCLYGIPGSGKTLFAEYLAVELDKPIIMKRASDILSKWVGDNEKNIAAMFREATEENAILFLDEADSFLRDRSTAKNSWEATGVNELLQQFERFNGIFICATNLFKAIDAAALRRFTFKFEFLAMNEEQRWRMFYHEANIANLQLTEDEVLVLKNNLLKIKWLAPGDFAVVKRQANILGSTLTPEEWITQLKVESAAKLEGIENRGIGFGANIE